MKLFTPRKKQHVTYTVYFRVLVDQTLGVSV